jgi:hypothetical protein
LASQKSIIKFVERFKSGKLVVVIPHMSNLLASKLVAAINYIIGDSLLSKVTGHGLDDQSLFPSRDRDFSLYHHI